MHLLHKQLQRITVEISRKNIPIYCAKKQYITQITQNSHQRTFLNRVPKYLRRAASQAKINCNFKITCTLIEQSFTKHPIPQISLHTLV